MKKSSNGRQPKRNGKAKSAAAGDVRIIGGQFKRRVVRFIDADGLRPHQIACARPYLIGYWLIFMALAY